MSTCDGTRNIRAVPRSNQRHERLTKTVVTSPMRKSWPSKPNPIYTLEGLPLNPLQCPVSPCRRGGNVMVSQLFYYHSILKSFQVDNAGMLRMTSSARYFKEVVGSRRPN